MCGSRVVFLRNDETDYPHFKIFSIRHLLNIEILNIVSHKMDLTIKCKRCGFEHTSNLYREDEETIEKKTSNHESCPSCGQVSTYDESDYD